MTGVRYWKIALGLALVFIAGALTGGFATRQLLIWNFNRSMNFEHWKRGTLQVLQEKLSLTAAQHKKIESLLDQRGREMRDIFSGAFHDCGRVVIQLQHQIDQELTPPQREIHEQMKREFRAELKKKFNFDLPAE